MAAVPTPQMREQRRDFDKFDDVCDHLLVVDRAAHGEDGQPLVVGTYRLIRDVDAARAGGFYTAGEFDMRRMLAGHAGARAVWNSDVPASSNPIATARPRCSFCGRG